MIEIVFPGVLGAGIPDPQPGCACCMCNPQVAADEGSKKTASVSGE